jgi:hypothetical protein
MAKKDSDRYRDEMKNFYNDELTLMCLGQGQNKDAPQGQGQVAANGNGAGPPQAAAAGQGGRMTAEQQQMASLLQQHQQQQAMMNDLALRQDLMMALAQERARAGQAGMNPFQAPMQPMNAGSAGQFGNPNVMNEDQLLQLYMLQQQQQQQGGADGGAPNEAFVKLVLSQKTAVQDVLNKLSQEEKTLHIKRAILDKIVSKELGPTGAQSEEARSPPSGLNIENLSVEELFQMLQQQQQQSAASGGAAPAPQPPGNNINMNMNAGLLLGQQQQMQPQMGNINPSYAAMIMAAQAQGGGQPQQMVDFNALQGMNAMQGMGNPPAGAIMNGGMPGMSGAPGGGGPGGASAEDMVKKFMAEQNSQNNGSN